MGGRNIYPTDIERAPQTVARGPRRERRRGPPRRRTARRETFAVVVESRAAGDRRTVERIAEEVRAAVTAADRGAARRGHGAAGRQPAQNPVGQAPPGGGGPIGDLASRRPPPDGTSCGSGRKRRTWRGAVGRSVQPVLGGQQAVGRSASRPRRRPPPGRPRDPPVRRRRTPAARFRGIHPARRPADAEAHPQIVLGAQRGADRSQPVVAALAAVLLDPDDAVRQVEFVVHDDRPRLGAILKNRDSAATGPPDRFM